MLVRAAIMRHDKAVLIANIRQWEQYMSAPCSPQLHRLSNDCITLLPWPINYTYTQEPVGLCLYNAHIKWVYTETPIHAIVQPTIVFSRVSTIEWNRRNELYMKHIHNSKRESDSMLVNNKGERISTHGKLSIHANLLRGALVVSGTAQIDQTSKAHIPIDYKMLF